MLEPGRTYINSEKRIRVRFTDEDGDAVNPTTVTIRTMDPTGAEETYVYGTDSEVQRESTGNYLADITPDSAGRWYYRWQTTGTGTTTAMEGSFLVQDSIFYQDTDIGYA